MATALSPHAPLVRRAFTLSDAAAYLLRALNGIARPLVAPSNGSEDPPVEGPEIDQPGDGWIATRATVLARIGADPQDDEDMRHKKALLVLLAVLILPVS